MPELLSDNVSLDEKKIVETGMSMTLILLLVGIVAQEKNFMAYATMALVVTMMFPRVYTPVARLWFFLSRCLGAVSTNIMLCLVFFTIVVPIALVRRTIEHDPMRLREWKRSNVSVFVERNVQYAAKDLANPY